MINCPLCNKELIRLHRRDFENDDVYCPTTVVDNDNYGWRHFERLFNEPAKTFRIEAIIPPFDLLLWQNTAKVIVFTLRDNSVVKTEEIYQVNQIDLPEFIELCKRFEKLKAFS